MERHTQNMIIENRKAFRRYFFIQDVLKMVFLRYLILFFILISIASVILSSFKAVPFRDGYFTVILLSSIAFFVEYLLRLWSAPAIHPRWSPRRSRLKYMLSFYGFIDFVAMLPCVLVFFYLDTPIVHIIILPFILITFKLIRYSRSFRLIGHVLNLVREELITAYTACGIMVCFSAILMYYIEHNAQPHAFQNIGDGLWWAIVAFTTVGYGDIYPITALGKILSSIISMIGIAMIAIPTGIISSAFIHIMHEKRKEKEENNE